MVDLKPPEYYFWSTGGRGALPSSDPDLLAPGPLTRLRLIAAKPSSVRASHWSGHSSTAL